MSPWLRAINGLSDSENDRGVRKNNIRIRENDRWVRKNNINVRENDRWVLVCRIS